MVISRKILIGGGVFCIPLLLFLIWLVYKSQAASNDEKLARQYCGSCHVFPEAGLLTKQIWLESVIPQMAFRMGFPNSSILSRISPNDLPAVRATLPGEPMITEAELNSIANYYWRNAPSELARDTRMFDSLRQFNPSVVEFNRPFITMLKVDSIRANLVVGIQSSWLFTIGGDLKVKDSIQLKSPPSHALFSDGKMELSLLGILMPNDEDKGELITLNDDLTNLTSFIDSLRRPVFFYKEDMNADGLQDFIVCAFGNYTGDLTIYESHGNDFLRHTLAKTPGAIKVEVRDFNNDGRNDILALYAQSDERLILYLNQGDFKFEEKILHRFQPAFGSNYFDLRDFNNDGFVDILLTNGDNGDFSIIQKPYHGIRIFENDGKNNFKESMFFPMPGASQVAVHDFDKDGDLDIAAISFFPDFENHPERTFIYLENKGENNFEPQTTNRASDGRWLVMTTWDYDRDGDMDIFLGASSYQHLGANSEIYRYWLQKAAPLMLLENNLYSPNQKD
jgi:hypothetical protein